MLQGWHVVLVVAVLGTSQVYTSVRGPFVVECQKGAVYRQLNDIFALQ